MKTQNNNSNIRVNTNITYHPCLPPELEKEGWRAVELEKDGRGNILLRIPSDLLGHDCEYRVRYVSDSTNYSWVSSVLSHWANLNWRVENLTFLEGYGFHLGRFAMIREAAQAPYQEMIAKELEKIENI